MSSDVAAHINTIVKGDPTEDLEKVSIGRPTRLSPYAMLIGH